jgi:hypothetical protein
MPSVTETFRGPTPLLPSLLTGADGSRHQGTGVITLVLLITFSQVPRTFLVAIMIMIFLRPAQHVPNPDPLGCLASTYICRHPGMLRLTCQSISREREASSRSFLP